MRLQQPACCNTTVHVDFTGAFQFTSELQSVQLYQSPGGLHIFVIAAEIICLLFILYYMFLQVKTGLYSRQQA